MTHQPADAVSILVDASDTITERGKQRDQPTGERSMGRCVQAFNAIYGTTLTEQQGWQFMALLKIARSSSGAFRLDDFVDQAGYAALAGECAARVDDSAEAHHARLQQLLRGRRVQPGHAVDL
ncbi:DUF6378 domain-containing protein [Rhodanobacter sp. BL-MT-08]